MSIFHMRYVDKDPEGYYYTRWDKAIKIEVRAATREQAFTELWNILGQAPSYRVWTAQIDKVKAGPCTCAETVGAR